MVCFMILLLGIDYSGFKHFQFHILWVLSTILCINFGNLFFSNLYLIDIFVIKKKKLFWVKTPKITHLK